MDRAPLAFSVPLLLTALAWGPAAWPRESAAAEQDEPEEKDEQEVKDEKEAERLFQEGNTLFDTGDYLWALERYRSAWRLDPRARYQLNIGVTLTALGRDAEAADAL